MKKTALGYELEGLLIKSCEALRAFQKVLSRSNQNHILSNFLTLLLYDLYLRFENGKLFKIINITVIFMFTIL